MKITKKQLKDLSTSLNAYYLGGNVYDYENCIYYINHNMLDNLKESTQNTEIITTLSNIDFDHAIDKQLAYSVGAYGNSGQLHEIKLYKGNNIVDTIYTYYC